MTVWISNSLTEMADLIRKSKNSRGKYIISSTKAASGPCLPADGNCVAAAAFRETAYDSSEPNRLVPSADVLTQFLSAKLSAITCCNRSKILSSLADIAMFERSFPRHLPKLKSLSLSGKS